MMSLATQWRQFSYLVGRRPYRLEKPKVIQFPVIDICNSQCQMCRIWENKKSDDVTPDMLRQGLRNPLFTDVEAVGLNGGEPTLRKDLGTLAEVLFDELPRLRSISLITNGYRFEEVIERMTDVGNVVSSRKAHFDVMVSLDGHGDMHDRVRGKPGNFVRSEKVIAFARNAPFVNKLRIGCTVIKENVYGVEDLLDYCKREDLYIKYRLGIPHQRLYTQNLLDPYALTADEKYHFAEFLEGLIRHYESSEAQRLFYRSLVDQLVRHAPRSAGCDWQHRGATITSKGELLYCAVESPVLGSIVTDDSEKVFFDGESRLREIVDSKCSNCNHDYVGLPPRRVQAHQWARKVLRRVHLEGVAQRAYTRATHSDLIQRRRFERRKQTLAASAAAEPLANARPRSDRPRILICGWYGTETLGDKAILGGIIEAVRAALGDADITIASLHPYVSEATRRQMPELKGTRIVEASRAAAAARHASLVILGGGPLMALAELAEIESIFDAAFASGVPSVVAGCGVGPLGAAWHNDSIRRILSLASQRVYRDGKSRELAASLGIDTSSDGVAEDPAFTWLQGIETKRPRTATRDRKILLLGLREFPHGQYARHLQQEARQAIASRYEREVVRGLEQLVENVPGLLIRPLPMCTNHFGDDDRWFYRRLFQDSSIIQPRLDGAYLGPELAPRDYCDAFTGADVALAMRFHSLVFALGLGVPSVAIDYTLGRGKVSELAERFEVDHRSLDRIDADFIVTQVTKQLEHPVVAADQFAPRFAAELGPRLRRALAATTSTR